jgi:arsenate reductase-like glutaredoxin family protein
MEDRSHELTLIYRSDKDSDNKIKAFVESLPGYIVRFVDVVRDSMSEKQIVDLARKMKVHIEDMIDPAFGDHVSVHNQGVTIMDRKDILSLLTSDPKILETPLVMIGDKATKFASAYKLLRKALES